MGVLAGGAFLVDFALHLGASPFVIGAIAALGPLTRTLQIPVVPTKQCRWPEFGPNKFCNYLIFTGFHFRRLDFNFL